MSKRPVYRENFSHITVPEGAKLIPLTKGKYALVDEEDYERLSQYNWQSYYSATSDSYYAITRIKAVSTSMTRYILSVKDRSIEVDHKNHDTLDNRKFNLRLSTHQQNSWNSKSKTGTTSKFKGVRWKVSAKRWVARIKHNKLDIHIGYFKTEQEAAKAYDDKAVELFGEFAYLNFKND